MQQLKSLGKIAYGLGIAGIGALHFVFPFFRPVLAPISQESTNGFTSFFYLLGLLLVAAGAWIAFGKQPKRTALLLGGSFLLLFLVAHLPNRIANHPEILGIWTDAFKLLSLAGGSFMVAKAFPSPISSRLFVLLDIISPYGQYFFGLMLIIFGIDHFLYTDLVQGLVPTWIPAHTFLAYLTGGLLIGAGLAIFLQFKPVQISYLLAAMLFIWLVVLHLPRAFAADMTDQGNEWTSVFECLAFSGMAILWPLGASKRS